MLFKKKKSTKLENTELDNEVLALTSLVPLCNGRVKNDSFILEDYAIYVYADIISLQDNVAQIVYQLHHEWLEDAIVETIAASGDSIPDAIHNAAQNFFDNILMVYLQSIEKKESETKISIGIVEPREYDVYRGKMNGVGVREGTLEGDFWDLLQEDVLPYITNKKAYWIRIFASKNKNNVICEVRLNGQEISPLSEKMLRYAEGWNGVDAYHSEKQGILLIQNNKESKMTVCDEESLSQFTQKAIALFEKCNSREEYKEIRKKLCRVCKDTSLGYELFSLVPEFYCMFAYAKVEFGDKVYLIRKNMPTKELLQSELASYKDIQQSITDHLKNDNVSRETIDNVLQYSATGKAIKKALNEGAQMEELMIEGIAILIPENFKIR